MICFVLLEDKNNKRDQNEIGYSSIYTAYILHF